MRNLRLFFIVLVVTVSVMFTGCYHREVDPNSKMLHTATLRASEIYWQEHPVHDRRFPLTDVGYPRTESYNKQDASMFSIFRVILWSKNSYDEIDLDYVVIAYANKVVQRVDAAEQLVMVRVFHAKDYEKAAKAAYKKAQKGGGTQGMDYTTFKTKRLKEISLSDTKAPYYLFDINGNLLDVNLYDLETLKLKDAPKEENVEPVDSEKLPLFSYRGFYGTGEGTKIAPKTGTFVETMWNIVVFNHNLMNNLLGRIGSNILGTILVIIGIGIFILQGRYGGGFSTISIIFIILLMLAMPTCVYAEDFDFYNVNDKFYGRVGLISMIVSFSILLIQSIKGGMRGFLLGLLAVLLIFLGGAFSSSWMAYVAYGIMILFLIIALLSGGKSSSQREYIVYQGYRVYGYSVDINTFKGDDNYTYRRISGDLWERE